MVQTRAHNIQDDYDDDERRDEADYVEALMGKYLGAHAKVILGTPVTNARVDDPVASLYGDVVAVVQDALGFLFENELGAALRQLLASIRTTPSPDVKRLEEDYVAAQAGTVDAQYVSFSPGNSTGPSYSRCWSWKTGRALVSASREKSSTARKHRKVIDYPMTPMWRQLPPLLRRLEPVTDAHKILQATATIHGMTHSAPCLPLTWVLKPDIWRTVRIWHGERRALTIPTLAPSKLEHLIGMQRVDIEVSEHESIRCLMR